MGRYRYPQLSMASRSSRVRFAVGLALVSVIPALTFWHLTTGDILERRNGDLLGFLVTSLAIAGGIAGYLLLRRYPLTISRLRSQLDNMARGDIPPPNNTAYGEADLDAINANINLVADRLRHRVEASEHKTQHLQQRLLIAEKMQSLGVMAMGMAHDYNNLLAAILGNASIVLRSMPPDSPTRNNAQQIEATTLRAIELTNQILAFSGHGRHVIEPIDLSQLIRQAESLITVSVPRTIDLIYDLPDSVPFVKGDPTQLRQAIINLVMNAADAVGEDAGKITVRVGSMECTAAQLEETCMSDIVKPGHFVFAEITDTGCGIPEGQQGKIFDPFFTTKIRGRGLGLSVALGITRSHEGTMTLHSTPDHGTCVRLMFPLAEGNPIKS